jgi:predicted heme/steroid binding protein
MPANVTLELLAVNNGTSGAHINITAAGAAPGSWALYLPPNSSRVVEMAVRVEAAGPQRLVLVVNGTPAVYNYTVYYFAPRLVAEPAVVNVSSLPAHVRVPVSVKNEGNYTGYVNGTPVPPGGEASVVVALDVSAAGAYSVQLGQLSLTVVVNYLAVGYSVQLISQYVEAPPGGLVSFSVELANKGNATEVLVVNGTAYELRPSQRLLLNFTTPAAPHKGVALLINGTKYAWNLNVSVIALNLLLKIGGYTFSPSMGGEVISVTQAAVPYQWIITDNATYRTVYLGVGGQYYALPPGGEVLINGTLNAAINQWNTVSVTINGTTYSMQIYVELTPPTIYIQSISGISFSDSRSFTQSVSCPTKTIGAVTTSVTYYGMEGVVSYSGNTITFSGSFEVYVAALGKTYDVSFSGSSTNGVGQVTATIGSYTAVVDFNNGAITYAEVGGTQIPPSCASIIPIPPFMYEEPPTGALDAVSLGSQLANLFAITPSDYVVNAYYNGQSVVLVDGAGHTMYFNFAGGLSISGPLSATISAQYHN